MHELNSPHDLADLTSQPRRISVGLNPIGYWVPDYTVLCSKSKPAWTEDRALLFERKRMDNGF